MSSGAPSITGGGAASGQEGALTDAEAKMVVRLFSDPSYFPMEFRAWIKNYIATSDITWSASSIIGVSGGTGTSAQTGLPAGIIVIYAGSIFGKDVLPCNGAAISRETYDELFDAIGVSWGPGDGTATFNVPDFRDRALYMAGSVIPLASTDGLVIGSRGGPRHHHAINLPTTNDPGHKHAAFSNSFVTTNGDTLDGIRERGPDRVQGERAGDQDCYRRLSFPRGRRGYERRLRRQPLVCGCELLHRHRQVHASGLSPSPGRPTLHPVVAIPLTVPKTSPYYYNSGSPQAYVPPKPKPPVVTPPSGGGYTTGPAWGGVSAPNDTATVQPYTPVGVASDPQISYGTAGGTGGNPVDWASLIGGSYEVAQAEAMMGAQVARAKTSLTNALRTNLIDLGAGAGTDLGNMSKYIDKATLQKAIDNKYSIYAQVADQQARANAGNDAQLAARGMLSSGQTTKSTQDVVNQGEQARYTGLREFLRSGTAGIEHVGDVKAQLAQGVMSARFAAAARLAQMYSGAGAGGGSALGSAPTPAPAAAEPPPLPAPYTPWQGGWLVPGGLDPQGYQSPYFVSPSSGLGGDLSWLNPQA